MAPSHPAVIVQASEALLLAGGVDHAQASVDAIKLLCGRAFARRHGLAVRATAVSPGLNAAGQP